jgi:uncharacterized membrane protein HdeD (DUF308 family)
MSTLFRKWWIILLQGILLIIISFIFFNNPSEVLAIISLWVGLLTIAIGVMGLVGHFMMDKDERENSALLWSIVTLLFGIMLVGKLGLTMKLITVLFGIWVLMTGIWLASAGWEYRRNGPPGLLMLIAGILSIIAGVAIIFDINIGAVWISTLLGVQSLLAGIGLVILAMIKRKVVSKLKSEGAIFRNS